jgi:adenylosuccinate synthase
VLVASAPHVVVADLGYGDAGKGSTVDWLCSPAGPLASGSSRASDSSHASNASSTAAGGEQRSDEASAPAYRAVIRYNGGAQAGHNVVTPDGRHHTFAQFGAGTFHGVPTHLSKHMLVEPFALAKEAAHLAGLGVPDPAALLSIDARALLTTPYPRAANRAREAARDRTPGSSRHGSCGMGIGETVSFSLTVSPDDAPRVGDCPNRSAMIRKLTALREYLVADLEVAGLRLADDLPTPEFCAEVYEAFAEHHRIVGEEHLPRLLASGPCVFEGAQGVLLDEWYGFHPHTTWSTTTFANALGLLAESGVAADDAVRLGVVRTFTTRHGAGPLVTEDSALASVLPEAHNGTGTWQGAFRFGHFDAVAQRYALAVCGGADALMVTHADRVPAELKVCRAYRTATGIPPLGTLPHSPIPDLDHQRVLTKTASHATPILVDGPAEAGDWPEFLAEELGVPLAAVSRGPSWTQKAAVSSRRC